MNPLVGIALLLGGLVWLSKSREHRRPTRRNLDAFQDSTGIHPIRGSEGYDEERAGDLSPRQMGIRTFVKDMDHQIAVARRHKDRTAAWALQEQKLSGIMALLPEKTINKYEEAQEQISQLEVLRQTAKESAKELPAYDYRDVATIFARSAKGGDVGTPSFRKAVEKRYGMSIDEIGNELFPEESRTEELALDAARQIKTLLATTQSRGINDEIKTLEHFLDRVESGRILGHGANIPKKTIARSKKTAKSLSKAITSLAGARRFGRKVKAAA